MKAQDPKKRIDNFNEVALGYTSEEAIAEAGRCLVCKKPACVPGCPVEVDIPKFVSQIKVQKNIRKPIRSKVLYKSTALRPLMYF